MPIDFSFITYPAEVFFVVGQIAYVFKCGGSYDIDQIKARRWRHLRDTRPRSKSSVIFDPRANRLAFLEPDPEALFQHRQKELNLQAKSDFSLRLTHWATFSFATTLAGALFGAVGAACVAYHKPEPTKESFGAAKTTVTQLSSYNSPLLAGTNLCRRPQSAPQRQCRLG